MSSNKNPTCATIKRGRHCVMLDPPFVRGGSARNYWVLRLNGHPIFWPKNKAEGRRFARVLLDAIAAGEALDGAK